MKKLASTILVGMITLIPTSAFADHYDGNDRGGRGDCSSEGTCNDQRRCYHAENCRGSFSPGPFDRSPVDIHDNQICVSPNCGGSSDEKKK